MGPDVINFAPPQAGNAPVTSTLFDRLVATLRKAFGVVDAQPLMQAVLIGPQTIGTTDTKLYHGLGRQPRGYFIVKAPADVRLFDGATPSPSPGQWITVRASSAQQLTVAVF